MTSNSFGGVENVDRFFFDKMSPIGGPLLSKVDCFLHIKSVLGGPFLSVR